MPNPWAVALALCAAHTAARAGLPAFMSQVAPARPDGLSASAGSPPGRSVAIAFAVGILALVLALGPGKALVSLILLALSGLMLARLAIRQIGGQTGDILGAFEQTGEILILLVAAAFQIGGGRNGRIRRHLPPALARAVRVAPRRAPLSRRSVAGRRHRSPDRDGLSLTLGRPPPALALRHRR